LTPGLLRLFIQKIVVHEKGVKWSKHAEQTVEIYDTDVGYVENETANNHETEEPRQTLPEQCLPGIRPTC
jgi:site-specific DNA recombinase